MGQKKSNINILVVEDNKGLNKLMCSHISRLGYNASSALTADEALQLLKNHDWTLILLDYKLNGTTAEQLIEKARSSNLLLSPFIIITGYGDEDTAVKMMKEGARDYWVKERSFTNTFSDRLQRAVQDIQNERKLLEARQEINLVEQQSRRVMEAMADPVAVINNDRKIVFHNNAFRHVFGKFTRQSSCYAVIFNRETPCPWCDNIPEDSNSFTNIEQLVEKDGQFLQPVMGPIRFNTHKNYKIDIFRDVTDLITAQRKAEKNEAILRNLIATARDAIVGVNDKGKIVLHNRAALELFSASADKFQNASFHELFSKDKHFLRFYRLFRQLTSTGKNNFPKSSFRLTFDEASGTEKYLDTSLTVNDINGEKLFLFILRDITDQHHAELELLNHKMVMRSLIDNLPDHIYMKDTWLRFLLSNKAHSNHLGVSENELLGKTDMDLYPEKLAKQYVENERKVIQSGRPKLNIKEKSVNSNGETRWILTSKIPIKDGYGKVKGIVGIGRDITELELKDQEIRKTTRRLEGLLEITLSEELEKSDILDLALDKAIELSESKIGYIYFYNEKTKEFALHSWSDTAMEQCKVANKHTSYPLEKTGIWGEAVRQRRPIIINDYSRENPLKKGLPRGHVPIRRFMTIPVFHRNQIVALAGVANKELPYSQTDLIQLELLMDTVWKIIVQKEQHRELSQAREKAEEAERMKTVFMSTMSHELRTPLNAILGFSQLIEYSGDKKEMQQFASYITESGERLLTIIENIFYISAIDGQHLNINEETFTPTDLIDKIIKQFKQKGISEHIRLEAEFQEENIRIKTDPRITEQIFRALIDNALKFTPSGSVTVGFRIAGNNIRYFVKDTGIGIPEKKREEVFEKFRQLDDSTTREYGGTGIGLYMVKRLTEVLSGKVWIENNQPAGTVFNVEIPVTIISETGTKEIKREISPSGKSRTTKTVLIAEDNPVSALLLKKTIADMGLQPVHVENGLEAVNHIRENKPCDLILMDLNMPVMDGFEAIEKIKGIRDDIPIIIQTAYDSETGREKARELKVRDFISKPLDHEQLVEKINRYAYGPEIMI